MAWYEGTMTTAAGELLAILDAKLPLNSYWSIYDAAAGTNAKVYRNYKPGENSNFYVYVGDNQTGYSSIQLWEGWNSGSHTGTGNSTTLAYIKKDAGAWGLSVLDLRFVFVNRQYGAAIYCGQLRRHDPTLDVPLIVAWADTTPLYNPLGSFAGHTEARWQFLRDRFGVVRGAQPALQSNSTTDSKLRRKCTNGKFWLLETPILDTNLEEQYGFLEGVMCNYYSPESLANEDIFIDTNSVEWINVLNSTTYCCTVRKN